MYTHRIIQYIHTLVTHLLDIAILDTHPLDTDISSCLLSPHNLGSNPSMDQEQGLDHAHLSVEVNDEVNEDLYQHAALSLLQKMPPSTTTSTNNKTAATMGNDNGSNDDNTSSSFTATAWQHKRLSPGALTTTAAAAAEGGGGGGGGAVIGIVKHVSFRQVKPYNQT